MGIRFQCQHCQHPLHLKSELAGRKGVCPECKGKFRIPMDSDATSDSRASNAVENTERRGPPVGKSNNKEAALWTASENTVPATSLDEKQCYWVAPPSGGRYGPADRKLLTEWAKQNRITPDSLLYVVPANAPNVGASYQDQTQRAIGGIRADVLLRDVFSVADQSQAIHPLDPLKFQNSAEISHVPGPAFTAVVASNGRVDAIAAAKNKRRRQRNFQLVILCGMLAVVALLCVALWAIMNRPSKAKVAGEFPLPIHTKSIAVCVRYVTFQVSPPENNF